MDEIIHSISQSRSELELSSSIITNDGKRLLTMLYILFTIPNDSLGIVKSIYSMVSNLFSLPPRACSSVPCFLMVLFCPIHVALKCFMLWSPDKNYISQLNNRNNLVCIMQCLSMFYFFGGIRIR